MYNKIILIGNLGKDPEEISVRNGESTMSKFTVATKANKDATPEWFTVVAFDKLAELTLKYLSKGSLVYIEGSFKSNTWEDTEGFKRTSYSITAYTVKFLSPKSKAQNEDKRYNDKSDSKFGESNNSEELPF